MADSSVARRAARRRKLLEGSEARFQKIKQLNDELKSSVEEDPSEKAQADSAGTTASSTPAYIPQTQSEHADKGEGSVSELPCEDSQEQRPLQAEAPTDAQLSEQESPCTRADGTVELDTDIKGHDEFSEDEHLAKANFATEKSTTQILHDSEHEIDKSCDVFGCHICSSSSTGYYLHSIDHIPRNSSQVEIKHSLSTSVDDIPSPSVEESLSKQPEPQAVATDEIPVAQTPTAEVQPIQFLTTRELFVVLFAVLMRLMFAFESLQNLTGKSVIIPFVVLQVTFFMSSQKQQPPAGMMFRVLSFAAMIAKIPQTSIQKFQHMLTVISQFFEDFALYLFAFVVTHEVVELIS